MVTRQRSPVIQSTVSREGKYKSTNQRRNNDKLWHLRYGIQILFEDDDIIVINKPSGLLSIANATEREKTVYWILNEYLRKKGERRQVAVVHRLDRETSGVMVFVKSEKMKKNMMKHWNSDVVNRRYIAVVEGTIQEETGTIHAFLTEDRWGTMVVSSTGLDAVTHWKLLVCNDLYSLVELKLETGRKHQIRVHMAFIGHPVAGDSKYGAKTNPLERLALHAESICFYHPRVHTLLEYTVPAPVQFKKLITRNLSG